ncbi:MAG: ATP-binding cassette domain-containing protein [Alphaproteobacteria bacterium]|nr:ATP-binding cassette domain-containing protein [Alphaproteobacteria bacterium]
MSGETNLLPLELRGVGLARGGKRVLKDIDCRFEAEPRRSLIIGPNGAGKSLLLRLCHGLVAPDEGEVRWHGAGGGAKRLARGQAMVFQRPVLLRRSARANLAFALKARGVAGADAHARIDAALRQTGLARLADAPARALSFGEQQRLALARALALRPRVLFLDEPTANLDPAAAHLVEDLVRQAAADGVRIVMTTHDLNQARRLADEVIFLHRGRIKERAPAAAFFAGPENDLARAFLAGELLWWQRRSIYDGIEDD